MSVMEFRGPVHFRGARYDFLGTLRAGWQAMLAHREERRTIVKLSRLPVHVIRDMGFDPESVYAALDGSWDEVDPARPYRNHLPRNGRV
ncbi:hypothetical protein [Neoaquamicrobium sediminum]|uniref:hypothetical protein n=1 Tax=Neoaquamicrobium sediminum TaxID=1849104 RepID=UPI0040361562